MLSWTMLPRPPPNHRLAKISTAIYSLENVSQIDHEILQYMNQNGVIPVVHSMKFQSSCFSVKIPTTG